MEYSESVRRYFDRPTRAGAMAGTEGVCVAGSAGRERDGLRIWLAARIVDNKVAEACFRAYGCPYTIATAALAAEQMEGRDPGSIRFAPLEAAQMLSLPDEKLNCALCAEDAISDLQANWAELVKSKSL